MAALTAPFVLVTWPLLLATYGFAGLAGTALPAAGVVVPFESVRRRGSTPDCSCRRRCSASRRCS